MSTTQTSGDGSNIGGTPDILGPLVVETDLEISGPIGPISVRGLSDSIRADISQFTTCLGLVRFGRGHGSRSRAIRGLQATMKGAGLTIEARWNHLRLARVGREARPTLTARLVRTPEIELTALGLCILLLAQLIGVWNRVRAIGRPSESIHPSGEPAHRRIK